MGILVEFFTPSSSYVNLNISTNNTSCSFSRSKDNIRIIHMDCTRLLILLITIMGHHHLYNKYLLHEEHHNQFQENIIECIRDHPCLHIIFTHIIIIILEEQD